MADSSSMKLQTVNVFVFLELIVNNLYLVPLE